MPGFQITMSDGVPRRNKLVAVMIWVNRALMGLRVNAFSLPPIGFETEHRWADALASAHPWLQVQANMTIEDYDAKRLKVFEAIPVPGAPSQPLQAMPPPPLQSAPPAPITAVFIKCVFAGAEKHVH